MKKRFIFLIIGILSGGISAQGNLYFYQNDGSKTACNLDAIKWLTFLAEGLVITHADNSESAISYTDLRFFSLNDYNFTTIEPVRAENISVYSDFANDLISIKNEQTMNEIRLYNLQGQLLMLRQPQASEITLSVSDYTSGVYILHIADGNGIHIQKIIKH
ncbi:MAG: T9SS type A sorting domain-containing protein [Candidatus Symbiothrix sp.]|jgi:hypothetical protein|nr:T9SS type A sorting domain-containing protein [Candidatus Symbiothrix sp.]